MGADRFQWKGSDCVVFAHLHHRGMQGIGSASGHSPGVFAVAHMDSVKAEDGYPCAGHAQVLVIVGGQSQTTVVGPAGRLIGRAIEGCSWVGDEVHHFQKWRAERLKHGFGMPLWVAAAEQMHAGVDQARAFGAEELLAFGSPVRVVEIVAVQGDQNVAVLCALDLLSLPIRFAKPKGVSDRIQMVGSNFGQFWDTIFWILQFSGLFDFHWWS